MGRIFRVIDRAGMIVTSIPGNPANHIGQLAIFSVLGDVIILIAIKSRSSMAHFAGHAFQRSHQLTEFCFNTQRVASLHFRRAVLWPACIN